MMMRKVTPVGRCGAALVCCVVVSRLTGFVGVARADEAVLLSVSVRSPRTTVLVCEPLVLDVAVRNDGDGPAVFSEMRKGHAYPLSFSVTRPDGQTWRYGTLRREERAKRPDMVLAPGQVYRYREFMFYGIWRSPRRVKKTGYPFPKPGRYTVRVVFQRAKWRFEAPPLTITAVESRGRERDALDLFRGWKQAFFVESDAREVPEEFKRLAEEYADTVYGRYVRYHLAAAPLEHRFDWERARRTYASELAGFDPTEASDRVREKVYRKSASEFADLARAESAFPLADHCLLYLAECHLDHRIDRKADAAKVLRDLVAKYPESPVAVEARKRLEKLSKEKEASATSPAP